MAWILLFVAGLLEVAWAALLPATEGLTRPVATVGFFALLGASMFALSKATEVIPIGTAYGVWVGIGAVGAALVGMALHGDPATLGRIGFLLLLVVAAGRLDDELEEASCRHDLERAARLASEREALIVEVGRVTGVGGRRRQFANYPAERARKAVSARVRDAIRKLAAVMPEVASHFERRIDPHGDVLPLPPRGRHGLAGRPDVGRLAAPSGLLAQTVKRKRVTSVGKSNHATTLAGVNTRKPPACGPSHASGRGS